MDLQTIRESLRKATDKAAPSPHTACPPRESDERQGRDDKEYRQFGDGPPNSKRMDIAATGTAQDEG